eukprot:TRINITY_DN12005_c0_g1_i1.p1 TRINITY_DN12005_c0_g1~~TRINITY_DN12005_c0_g1_i1.p1  ORF type:complete len:343 (-),score=84.25 TRINITY_DN12005_c0_g1_i1:170-1162(-)
MEDSQPLAAYNITPLNPEVTLVNMNQPRLCIMGGTDEMGEALCCGEIYDPATGVWSDMPPMATRRTFFDAVSHEDQIYVMGGEEENNLVLGSVEVCDASMKSWTDISPMATRRAAFAAVVLHGKIYVIGGHDDDDQATASVEVWTPTSLEDGGVSAGIWTSLSPMASPRERLAAAVVGQNIFVAGGIDSAGHALSCVEVYDPINAVWTFSTPMRHCRGSLAAVALGDTLFLVLGGHDENRQSLASAEIFDTDAGMWMALPPMTQPRTALAAAVLSPDHVYVMGGYRGMPNRDERFGASAEVFDVSTQAWMVLPNSGRRRASPSAAAIMCA